ncbi:MAG: hypothetical protein R3296_07670 [Oleiphilaceae bacterium]|nr:hypothetical protein [Oleiphilaceae bacterium]
MIEKRLIGLSDEVALERRLGIQDLHIGWQVEEDRQYQADPEGRVHIAPVVRWKYTGTQQRLVPALSFREDNNPETRLRRFFGLFAPTRYRIDGERLLKDIERDIRRHMNDMAHTAA